jgi:phi13 family phage major tail protein
MAANKVKFGLKNVHYAIATETTTLGVTTTSYGTPEAFPGAVSLEVNPSSSDATVFRADDSDYYIVSGSEQGFDGSFECANIPEAFETDVLGATTDDNGVIVEFASDEIKYVALMFEINGDASARRYLVPKVKFAKPGISAETTGENGNEPKTTKLDFTASPRPDDGLARVHTGDNTDSTTYNGWFTTVYTPEISP